MTPDQQWINNFPNERLSELLMRYYMRPSPYKTAWEQYVAMGGILARQLDGPRTIQFVPYKLEGA